jgi:hypothetical protein
MSSRIFSVWCFIAVLLSGIQESSSFRTFIPRQADYCRGSYHQSISRTCGGVLGLVGIGQDQKNSRLKRIVKGKKDAQPQSPSVHATVFGVEYVVIRLISKQLPFKRPHASFTILPVAQAKSDRKRANSENSFERRTHSTQRRTHGKIFRKSRR